MKSILEVISLLAKCTDYSEQLLKDENTTLDDALNWIDEMSDYFKDINVLLDRYDETVRKSKKLIDSLTKLP